MMVSVDEWSRVRARTDCCLAKYSYVSGGSAIMLGKSPSGQSSSYVIYFFFKEKLKLTYKYNVL